MVSERGRSVTERERTATEREQNLAYREQEVQHQAATVGRQVSLDPLPCRDLRSRMRPRPARVSVPPRPPRRTPLADMRG